MGTTNKSQGPRQRLRAMRALQVEALAQSWLTALVQFDRQRESLEWLSAHNNLARNKKERDLAHSATMMIQAATVLFLDNKATIDTGRKK
jgi:hypothetical protein